MFSWIVKKINSILSPKFVYENDEFKKIELVEITSLENNANNNYDQFYMNYLQEKINILIFNNFIKKELDEFSSEGMDLKDIKFKENKLLLELFEKQASGIFGLLDEICLANGDDKAFYAKISKAFPNNNLFKISKTLNKFNILHTFKEVEYNSIGFVSKNKEELKMSIIESIMDTKNLMIKMIFLNCTDAEELNVKN